MDKYTKVRNIGKGNMGACALARNNEDGQYYVIKQVDLTRMSKKERQQSLNEARLLSSLRHPNIINYVDSFLAKRSDHLCIVMEFADGGDLCTRIKKNYGVNFRESLVLDWFIQIVLSLNYVHRRKILHRDVKSQNVFLTGENIVKLGDFGIARTLANTFDQAKTFVGTPYYLSPELILERPYDHRSDVWAVGVMLYEMLALKHPFNANDMKGLMQRILKAQYDPLPMMYSTEIRNIVPRLLMKDPEQRLRLDEVLELPIVHQRMMEWLKGDVVPQKYLDSLVKQRLLPESIMQAVDAAAAPSPSPTPPAAAVAPTAPTNVFLQDKSGDVKLPDISQRSYGVSDAPSSSAALDAPRQTSQPPQPTSSSGAEASKPTHSSEPYLHMPSIGLPARSGNTPALEKLSSQHTSTSVSTSGQYNGGSNNYVAPSGRYKPTEAPNVIRSPKSTLQNIQSRPANLGNGSSGGFSSYSRAPATAREPQPRNSNLDNFYQHLNYYQQGGRYVPRYPQTASVASSNAGGNYSGANYGYSPSTARRTSMQKNYAQGGYINPHYRPAPLSSSSSSSGIGTGASGKQSDIKALLQKAAMERAQRRLGEVK